MKQITLNLSETIEKLNEISSDNMDFVELSFSDFCVDQDEVFPAFVNFCGIDKDGLYKDYSSIDSVSIPEFV
ncbi:hypothetical protein SDC9_134892 [bioreactor metagenome]|uniref:Uncharacterized protein n=1 Tax=bioreactor metagenome TaxID=1076179 RepID=A0A645DGT7_9ZZZZ